MQLAFTRHRAELTYVVEGSSDLLGCIAVATNPGALGEPVSVVDSEPASPRRFLRLRASY